MRIWGILGFWDIFRCFWTLSCVIEEICVTLGVFWGILGTFRAFVVILGACGVFGYFGGDFGLGSSS